MVICLERGADLHMAQLMPLPLTVSCFSKIQVVPDKGLLNRYVCVCLFAMYNNDIETCVNCVAAQTVPQINEGNRTTNDQKLNTETSVKLESVKASN